MPSGRKMPKIEKIARKRRNIAGEILKDKLLWEELKDLLLKNSDKLKELLQNADALSDLAQNADKLKELAQNYKQPRTDLEGLRVRKPGTYDVYLIDNGYKRWIPDDETYNNLFSTRDNIHSDLHLDEIPDGMDIPPGTRLINFGPGLLFMAEWNAEDDWYSRLRHIKDQGVIDRYQFDEAKAENWQQGTTPGFAAIPPAPPIADDPDALTKDDGPPY